MILSTSNLALLNIVLVVSFFFLRWITMQSGGETKGLKILRLALMASILIVSGLYFYMRYGTS